MQDIVTQQPPEPPGLAQAVRALAAGAAVVVPNPAPMAYGILASSPVAVNLLKRRRPDQNVAVSLHDAQQWDDLVPSLDLPAVALAAVAELFEQRLSILLPLRESVPPPHWVLPAVRDGVLAAFNGSWAATAPLWQQFPRLYGSSANPTGQPPAVTAGQAAAMFGADCVVVDGDALDVTARPRAASTVVRLDHSGRLRLHRSGAQDAMSGLDPVSFVRRLAVDTGLVAERTRDA